MKVEVFAVLKEYFNKEFEVANEIADVADLKTHLADINPAAANLLAICRFAVQEEFVDDNYVLNGKDKVIVIPPSSGG